MHIYSRPIVGFAITVGVILLCYLGARAELVRTPRTPRQAVAQVAQLDGSESQRAYQFCLRYIADGCAP
jgi:hypothetical protein